MSEILRAAESGATIGSTGSTVQSEDDRDDLNVGDTFQSLGWKAVLLLQFQPQFITVIMISIYISFICSMIDVTYAYGAPNKEVPHTYSPTGVGVIFAFDLVYAVDILLAVMYKNTEWAEMRHLYDERHALMILLDAISIVPLDAMYHSLTNSSMKVTSFIRLRYALRIFRLMTKMDQIKNTIGINHMLIEILDFLLSASLLLITTSCSWYLLVCESKCKYEDIQIVEAFFIMAGRITSRGYPTPTATSARKYFLQTVTNLFSFIYIRGFVMGLCLIAVIQRIKNKNVYNNAQTAIINKIVLAEINDDLVLTTNSLYYNLFWKCRQGIVFSSLEVGIVPEIIAKEINLDICWDALHHSHLFRNKEVHFLRFAATYMQQKFMIPGETIYKRNQFKSSMLYVATGVIQILSEEDGESPILSLSGGTCIGESTLFVDYPSTCSVVCKTTCELYILERKDFMNILLKYPHETRDMLKHVRDRYKHAKEYQELLDVTYDENKQKREVLIMKWLKSTLHDLSKTSTTSDNEIIITTLEERETMNEFDKLIFCCNYLDMLVIAEQIELVTDTVFLRTNCPCILQPDSFIVKTWNNLIVLAVFMLALVYPYYACFQPKVSDAYFIFSYIISVFWILDIYITLSTGIRTREGIIAKVTQIGLYKCTTPDFILDLVAAFPLELSALLVAGYPGSQLFVLLQSLRLLKMYRIGLFFDEGLTIFNVITRSYLKYMIYMLLLTYYVAAMLYLQMCYKFVCDTNNLMYNFIQKLAGGNTMKVIMACIYLSMQQITGLGFQIEAEGTLNSLFVSLMIIQTVATLFYINLVANVIATDALKRYDIIRLKEYTANVLTAIENVDVSPRLHKNVVAFIRGQHEYNQGADILYPPSILKKYYLHPFLMREVRKHALLNLMQDIPAFKGWPNELLGNIAGIAFINITAPGMVIAHAGEICKEMHIITNGFCQIYSSAGEEPKTIGMGSGISIVELCCGIPVVNNVVSLTHCKICSFIYEPFMQQLQAFPKQLLELQTTANTIIETINLEGLRNVERSEVDSDSTTLKSDEDISFKHFGYRLDMDSKKGADFHEYFNKFGFFNCLRYVFIRHTITPYGRFLRYWEISRCIFAFITAILTPITFIAGCKNCHWNYILIFLDATAWLDILVRHHICYFDEKGIEISHPLKTAIYYWKHSFIIDLLGVLPFEIILSPLFKNKMKIRQRVFLQMTRMLQIYRVRGGISFLNNYLLSPSQTWSLIKYVPIVLIFINFMASMLINSHCKFDPSIPATDTFTAGVTCSAGTLISESKATKPLSPLRAYLFGMYITTVTILGPGLGGFAIKWSTAALKITATTLLGYWILIYITARVVANRLFRNVDFTAYQDAMHKLVKFLSYRRIDTKLKHEVIEHFEHVWRKKQGKDLHKTIKDFNYALQEDILLDVFGKTMKESAVFSQANDSFFRSLLLNVKHILIMKRGIITQVNRINKKIYFIFKGQVEVLGPDYNRLLILPVGSIFGNIDNILRSRQTLTMIAKGHVELLTINTITFYHILRNYHNLYERFRILTSVNTDYLLGNPELSLDDSSLMIKSNATISRSNKSFSKTSAFLQQIKQFYTLIIWEYIILILVCYIGTIFELYRVVVRNESNISIFFLYFLDCLFIINIILKFRTVYEDEFGVLITDSRHIARRYLKDPFGFPLQFASVIPFEIIALFFTNSRLRWRIWNYCRWNRFLRICFIYDYFRKRNKLNVNVNVMRTVYVLVWIYALLQVLTSLLIAASCTNPKYNTRPVINCTWEAMTVLEKRKTYSYQYSIILFIFTATNIPDYFPNSPLLTLFLIFLLIGSRFCVIHVIAEIAATLNIVLKKRTSYEKHIERIKEHIVRERISPALLERILVYVGILWKMKAGLQFPVLLLDAPYYLREGVLNSMFGCHLRRHERFRFCHVDLIRQVAAQFLTRTFFPGDNIAFINDSDGCMYFIHEGSVDVLSEDDLYDERIDKVLKEGDVFGLEQGLYAEIGHEYTYRANRHTLILILERKRWIHLLDFFPASKSILLNKNEAEKCHVKVQDDD